MHSNYIVEKWGSSAPAWFILMDKPINLDKGGKEAAIKCIYSRDGQAQIKSWMTNGDTTVQFFTNADVNLNNYFGKHSK